MLSRGLGGIEVAFAHYAQALVTSGMQVTCCIAAGSAKNYMLPAAATVIPINHASQFDPRAIWRARQLVRATQPDIVLVHGRRAYIIFSLALKLLRNAPPLIQVLHRPRFKNLRRAQHIITVSESLRQQTIACGIPPAQVTTIPNFLPLLPQAAPPAAWQTPPVIGVLGRFMPVKGIDLFIEALSILKSRGIRAHARIGGNGEYAEILQSHARTHGVDDQIEWLGWIKDHHVFYQSIDLFCVPSRAESFGLVVLEAFAHHIPVISTRTSGPTEIIDDQKTGLLCDISALALADCLQHALQHETQIRALATAATAACARYTLTNIAPQIAQCLTRVRHALDARQPA